MNSESIGKYEDNEIRIMNDWFSGEKLYVNNELQDEQINIFTPSNMTGSLINRNGEKLNIKTNISGFFTMSCRLFVDNKKVELMQTR